MNPPTALHAGSSRPSSSMEEGRVEVWPRRSGDGLDLAPAPSSLHRTASASTSIPDSSSIEGEGSHVLHLIVLTV